MRFFIILACILMLSIAMGIKLVRESVYKPAPKPVNLIMSCYHDTCSGDTILLLGIEKPNDVSFFKDTCIPK